MSLKFTIEGISTQADALAVICALESAFNLAPIPAHLRNKLDDSEAIGRLARERAEAIETAHYEATLAKEEQALSAKIDAGIFTSAELANDAEPVTAIVDLDTDATGLTTLDPATIGFGQAVPPPPSEDLATASFGVAPHPAGNIAVQVDSKGFPHDPRIHASTKTKIADGSWKRKPRVEPEYVATVEAELRSIMAIPTPAGAPLPPAAPLPAVVAPPPPAPAHLPTPTPPVSFVPSAPAVTDTAPTTFAALMGWLTPRLTNGTINRAQVGEACAAQGLKDAQGVGSVALLQQRPDLVPAVHAALAGA